MSYGIKAKIYVWDKKLLPIHWFFNNGNILFHIFLCIIFASFLFMFFEDWVEIENY